MTDMGEGMSWDETETAAERRARFRSWMADESDAYYRHQFWLASLTPGERLRRWWVMQWPLVAVQVALVVAVFVMVLV